MYDIIDLYIIYIYIIIYTVIHITMCFSRMFIYLEFVCWSLLIDRKEPDKRNWPWLGIYANEWLIGSILGAQKVSDSECQIVKMPKNEVDNNSILDLIIFNNRKVNENREHISMKIPWLKPHKAPIPIYRALLRPPQPAPPQPEAPREEVWAQMLWIMLQWFRQGNIWLTETETCYCKHISIL